MDRKRFEFYYFLMFFLEDSEELYGLVNDKYKKTVLQFSWTLPHRAQQNTIHTYIYINRDSCALTVTKKLKAEHQLGLLQTLHILLYNCVCFPFSRMKHGYL